MSHKAAPTDFLGVELVGAAFVHCMNEYHYITVGTYPPYTLLTRYALVE